MFFGLLLTIKASNAGTIIIDTKKTLNIERARLIPRRWTPRSVARRRERNPMKVVADVRKIGVPVFMIAASSAPDRFFPLARACLVLLTRWIEKSTPTPRTSAISPEERDVNGTPR